MCFDQIHPNPFPPILPPVCPTTIPSQFHVLKKKKSLVQHVCG